MYLVMIGMYFGVGATLGFLLTYFTLRLVKETEGEEKYPRSTACGLSMRGALAGGAVNFVVVWIASGTGIGRGGAPTAASPICRRETASCFGLLPALRSSSETFHLLNGIAPRPVTRVR